MSHDAGAHGQPGLAHHFESYDQQRESATLGMWLFLAQEIMFFGGLFTAYLLYRWKYAEDFAIASSHLDWKLGMFNTAVLIISSLTMALAVRSSQTNDPKATVRWLILTGGLGGVFLLVKAYEYHHKWVDGIIPGLKWSDPFPEAPHAQMFYFIYFIMTGLHALHMVVGIGILGWLIPQAAKGRFNIDNHNYVEGFGLYWHFVDIVWIFLFPLLYLIGRHVSGH